MLMSGSRVVISEPQAGRQEAAKQLVIWCGLRYRSPGVKLCVSERHAEPQVRRRGPATCVRKETTDTMRLFFTFEYVDCLQQRAKYL